MCIVGVTIIFCFEDAPWYFIASVYYFPIISLVVSLYAYFTVYKEDLISVDYNLVKYWEQEEEKMN